MKNWQVLSLIHARANVHVSELRKDRGCENCNEQEYFKFRIFLVCVNINF